MSNNIFVGIDIAKDKHDCIILDSKGKIIVNSFTIKNNREGFDELYSKIILSEKNSKKIKIGLEATGHYAYNILGYLLSKDLAPYVINPLYTSTFKRGLSLRKTKTDKVDAKTIAQMLITNTKLKPYSKEAFENEELKSLTRYRFKMIHERAKLKQSVSRLVVILFPELEKLVSTLHLKLIYAIFSEYSSIKEIANTDLDGLTELISNNSNGYHKEKLAIEIINSAKKSIGSDMPSKFIELKYTIEQIKQLTKIIKSIEKEILIMMKKIDCPIKTIPGVSEQLSAAIIAEIGDFSNFSSPDKILAFAGLSPTTYQSGQIYSSHAKMEKRGSRYLRHAIFSCAMHVSIWEPTFKLYIAKKKKEGKHHYVALSHVAKKFVRLIYHLQKDNKNYILQN